MKELIKEKKNLWLLLWPLGLTMYFTAMGDKELAEYFYAGGIFKVYSGVMSRLTGMISVSIAEILVLTVPIVVIIVFLVGLIKIITGNGERWCCLVRLIRNLALIAGIIYFWFMLGCGTNYYRYEFADYSGYTIEKSTTDELYGLCRHLVNATNEARKNAVSESEHRFGIKTDVNNVYESYLTTGERKDAAVSAMNKLGEQYEVLSGYYPRPKSVVLSKCMSEFNITGVYFPWTVEANINVDEPDFWHGVTMCHELSHLRGFMREDEANFIGYLACVESGEPELVYSGYLEALINSMNRLYSEDPELYMRLAGQYSEGLVADLRANSEYWKQYENTVASEVGEKVNDTYLKANKQTDGTKSYGRMVDLLLAQMRSEGGYDE